MPQPPNMQQMMRQVQKMQQDMMEAQEQLKHEEVEASAGGGMVKVKVSGDLVVKAITIAPDAIDPDDPDLLQDMVLAAVNEGMRAAQELQQSKLGGLTGTPLRVQFELRDLDPADDAAEQAPPSEDEIVARFVTEFDAEEIVQDPDPSKEGES